VIDLDGGVGWGLLTLLVLLSFWIRGFCKGYEGLKGGTIGNDGLWLMNT
jgi:hypothetical protein